ncbi:MULTISPECIES: YfcL family protein [Thalassotalea]|uniref:YfcL family protein n=1 Tax=Thalassotalea castellviae TaxID=3075612 RepID=A0ABU3A0P7_9GAMM|nr:YfcL family protein [Thalassotalea sp. W431]MDT0602698.1 YfcL family protein [Thalassotalea sp. W431]
MNLQALYQYFDELVAEEADSDTLFASSYIRGFIALVAAQFGDENQVISVELCDRVSEELSKAKTELTPQDNAIVNNYWLSLQKTLLV